VFSNCERWKGKGFSDPKNREEEEEEEREEEEEEERGERGREDKEKKVFQKEEKLYISCEYSLFPLSESSQIKEKSPKIECQVLNWRPMSFHSLFLEHWH